MTQILTLDEIKANARAFYDAGKLTAQNDGGCVYMGKNDCRCAIGASFTDETLTLVIFRGCNSNESIFGLYRRDIIASSEDEKAWISGIQDAHDAWARFPASHSLQGDTMKIHMNASSCN